jgi:hypothetical protein
MRTSLVLALIAAAIAGSVVYVAPQRAIAQQPTIHWAVMTYKVELLPDRPMMMITGPFPSEGTCGGFLAITVEGVKRQGIELASEKCRSDITITVP